MSGGQKNDESLKGSLYGAQRVCALSSDLQPKEEGFWHRQLSVELLGSVFPPQHVCKFPPDPLSAAQTRETVKSRLPHRSLTTRSGWRRLWMFLSSSKLVSGRTQTKNYTSQQWTIIHQRSDERRALIPGVGSPRSSRGTGSSLELKISTDHPARIKQMFSKNESCTHLQQK